MDVASEYQGVELWEARLNKRLVTIVESLKQDPAQSFPTAAGNEAALEAMYRFFAHKKVTPEGLLASHIHNTVARCEAKGRVIIAHDTTEFNFGKSAREDLGQVGRGKSFGFYGHFALALCGGEERTPLGVLGWMPYRRTGNKGRRGHRTLQNDATNEGLRWGRLVHQVHARKPKNTLFLHVMDREADSYALMAELSSQQIPFVIRMVGDTRKVVGDGVFRVGEALQGLSTQATREVEVSARQKNLLPSYRRLHPERKQRKTVLSIRARKVTLVRPDSSNQTQQETLSLHVVHVLEEHPPKGEEPVEWRLWTKEPIETEAHVLAVVDAYRARWRIEEFFKALKTGCSVEKRQLESQHSLQNAVALLVPMAVQLLCLRVAAQETPTAPAGQVLSPRQLFCLRQRLIQQKRPALSDHPTVREALWGIAALGGHLRRNGEPGWIVLGRGFELLLTLEQGMLLTGERLM